MSPLSKHPGSPADSLKELCSIKIQVSRDMLSDRVLIHMRVQYIQVKNPNAERQDTGGMGDAPRRYVPGLWDTSTTLSGCPTDTPSAARKRVAARQADQGQRTRHTALSSCGRAMRAAALAPVSSVWRHEVRHALTGVCIRWEIAISSQSLRYLKPRQISSVPWPRGLLGGPWSLCKLYLDRKAFFVRQWMTCRVFANRYAELRKCVKLSYTLSAASY